MAAIHWGSGKKYGAYLEKKIDCITQCSLELGGANLYHSYQWMWNVQLLGNIFKRIGDRLLPFSSCCWFTVDMMAGTVQPH